MMGTGDVMGTQIMTEQDSTFLCLFLFFFNLFSHQHSENHEQCGHAEAYSTVMLWGNSQKSNMPLCHCRLKRTKNRSTVATLVTLLLFYKQSTSHSFGSL